MREAERAGTALPGEEQAWGTLYTGINTRWRDYRRWSQALISRAQ